MLSDNLIKRHRAVRDDSRGAMASFSSSRRRFVGDDVVKLETRPFKPAAQELVIVELFHNYILDSSKSLQTGRVGDACSMLGRTATLKGRVLLNVWKQGQITIED
jgi:hypothetical protein